MKTKEELNAIKEEVKAFNDKMSELTEEEIMQVFGGDSIPFIGRHNIRKSLTGMINIDLNGYNYSFQELPLTVDQPNKVNEEDKRSLLFDEKK